MEEEEEEEESEVGGRRRVRGERKERPRGREEGKSIPIPKLAEEASEK